MVQIPQTSCQTNNYAQCAMINQPATLNQQKYSKKPEKVDKKAQ